MPEVIELVLDGIAHGGEAFGHHAGRVVFVPYAIPGEHVRVTIVEARERWARGRLIEVVKPSPDRVEPPCPYFGPDGCGGCQWQHIAYARQAALKQQLVADQLRRLGHITSPPVADVVALVDPLSPEDAPSVLDYEYRNQVQFAVSQEGCLGFRRTAGQGVIVIDRCLLLDSRLDELQGAVDAGWPALTGVFLRVGMNTNQALIVLETNSEEQPELEIDLPAACVLRSPGRVQPLIGEPWIEEIVNGRRFRISSGSPFPVNTVGAHALMDIVLAYAALRPDDVLLDVYCGLGLFAIPLALQAAEVVAVEPNPSACEDLAYNAGDQVNIALHEGAVDEVLAALRTQAQHVDVVVMDPPLTGAGPAIIHELATLAPRRIVYVSDDPAVLGRDAVYLRQAGYELAEAQPVDMRPQTCHVETVALWES